MQPKPAIAYVVTVTGPLPTDLSERLAQLEAKSILAKSKALPFRTEIALEAAA